MMDWKKLVVALVICQMAGFTGALFTTTGEGSWYSTVNKPDFNPPNWVFAPVWTTLYLLMGVALFLVWDKGFKKNKTAIYLFGIQLELNVLWSILFFGLSNPGAAFIEIIFLWAAILATILKFWKVSKPAAWMLVPYLAWVSFASLLNFAIWTLN